MSGGAQDFDTPVHEAVAILRAGGVIAYPTEGVFGLGCLPDNEGAVTRLLALKNRDVAKGLILVAADRSQLEGWIATDKPLPSTAEKPVTWIAPAGPKTPAWIRGQHAAVAVRIIVHRVAEALCKGAGSPLVSTSANLSGKETATDAAAVREQFGDQLDYIVPGSCGPATGPSTICDSETGETIRLPTT